MINYTEKPSIAFEASMGVYAVSPSVLRYIEPNRPLDFPDLVIRLLEAGESVSGWCPDAYWLDIGRHEDYDQAIDEFERMATGSCPRTPTSMRRPSRTPRPPCRQRFRERRDAPAPGAPPG